MSEQRRNFTFNSALTALDENGKFQEERHNQAVLPLRAKIMKLDGTTGCDIARYGVEVKYLPDAVTERDVVRHVRAVFAEAASQPEFFASLGGKKLKVACDWRKGRKRPTELNVYIDFQSSLTAFVPASGESKTSMDWDAFRATTRPLVEQMTNLDGVLGWSLLPLQGRLRIDTRITSVSAAKAHLEQVFTEAARREEFFPFVASGQAPRFQFWTCEF